MQMVLQRDILVIIGDHARVRVMLHISQAGLGWQDFILVSGKMLRKSCMVVPTVGSHVKNKIWIVV